MIENNNEDNDNKITNGVIRKQVEEERREIQEAEQHQLRLEFATNIIAAHKYCLRNVIHTGQGFDCEILYLPLHKDPNDSDTFFTRIFKVRTLKSEDPIIECNEKRYGWGGTGELYLGPEYIEPKTAEGLIDQALAIAATLLKIPEKEEDHESFFAELEEEEDNNGDGVVKQQEHNHELDYAIAELCADVEVEFFEPRMSR